MLCSINLDISIILDYFIYWIGKAFTFLKTTTVQITESFSVSLADLFIAALALAVLINIVFPEWRAGDIGEDDMEDYQD